MEHIVNVIKECKAIDKNKLLESYTKKLMIEFEINDLESIEKQSIFKSIKEFFQLLKKLVNDFDQQRTDYNIRQNVLYNITKEAKTRIYGYRLPTVVIIFLEQLAKSSINMLGIGTAAILGTFIVFYGWAKFEKLLEKVFKKDANTSGWLSKLAALMSTAVTVPILIIMYFIIFHTKDYLIAQMRRGATAALDGGSISGIPHPFSKPDPLGLNTFAKTADLAHKKVRDLQYKQRKYGNN